MKILIADDNKENLYLLETLLKSHGYEVVSAVNGAEALEKARRTPPYIIITDILMPVMDGFTLCREWKGDDRLKEIPLIFYTATYTDPKDEELALRLGADRFIVKPVEPDEFIKIIHGVIRDVGKGKIEPKGPGDEVFKLYSERLLKKLEKKMLDLEREITKRKQAEEVLRESEKKYRTLLKTTSEGWWLLNSERKTVEVNQALCNMLGYSEKEILGKTPFDFVDDENRKIFIEQISKIPTTHHRSYEIILKKKNGEDLYTHFNASTVRDESGDMQGSFALIIDITERKQAQKERDRLAIAIEQAAESVFITDRDGMIQYVNPAFERLTGYSRKDAIGQNPRILKSGKHDALFYKEIWDILTRGDAWHGRIINKKKDGSFYEADATISPVSDKSGKITNFVSIKHDVTHEVELEKRLIQAQKMEAIGTLAGGIAHDFNNLLTAIIGNAQLALMKVIKDEFLRKEIQEIKKAGEMATSLTRQLLAFSRKQIIKPEILDINEEISETEKMLKRMIREDIEFLTVLEPELWKIHADPGQINQVIMNLVVNAKDAMPRGGKLTIETANVELDDIYFQSRNLESKPGPYVMLAVTDNGTGMDEETLSRIFDPFFTTKEIGRGTGLGLPTVYGIMKQNNGYVWVYSEPGKGTTFKVYFPKVAGDVVIAGKEQEERADEISGSETVLIVEDDDGLRYLVKKALQGYGYKILEAENGEKALNVSETYEGPIHLLLTDIVMPGMSGTDLSEKLQSIRPEIQVIYMSGYTDNAIVHHGILRQNINFIEKPFSPEGLGKKVRQVLDKGTDD